MPLTQADLLIPPDLQAQRDQQRMGILEQEQQDNPDDPALNREIEIERGRGTASPPSGGWEVVSDKKGKVSFDTKLSSDEEQQFQQWKAQYAPRDSGADYDLRGAFKAGLQPDPQTGHWPDTFKKPNHPTFSDQSQYAAYGNPGRWEGEKYIPGKTSDGWEVVASNPSFLDKAKEAVTGAGKAIIEHPLQAVPGVAEAVAGAAVGLGTAAVGGFTGIAEGIGSWIRGKGFESGFNSGLQKVLGAASKLPMENETKVGEELSKVLALIPEGIHSLGGGTFDWASKSELPFVQTGAALLATGVEGLATLATLKPAAVTRTIGWAFDKARAGDVAATTAREMFDDAAIADPQAAREVANKVDDPALQKELHKRIDEMVISKPSQVKEIIKQGTARPSGEVTQGDLNDIFANAKKNTAEAVEETPAATLPGKEMAPGEVQIRSPQGDRTEFTPETEPTLKGTLPSVMEDVRPEPKMAEGVPPEPVEPARTEPQLEPPQGPSASKAEDVPRSPVEAAANVRSTVAAAESLLAEDSPYQALKPGAPTTAMQEAVARPQTSFTPEFRKWFSGSKLVDEKGKPLTVYHGTTKDFSEFSKEFFGETSGSDLGDGFYFTDSPKAASNYAQGEGGNVRPSYVRIQKPATNDVMNSPEIRHAIDDDMGFKSIQEILAEKGYDGIIYKHPSGEKEIIAFEPEQIRSVTGVKNQGSQIVYLNAGIPVTRAALQDAFSSGRALLRKADVYRKIEDEVTTSVDQLIRNVNPEALGKDARAAAAVVAHNLAEQMQKDSMYVHRAQARRDYWSSRTPQSQLEFIEGYERGRTFKDPVLERAAAGYRAWSDAIFSKDQSLGLKYKPEDNYLYHAFEYPKAVARFLEKRFGPKWSDPSFTKERSFHLYSQAMAAGFRPKFTNPEDIMLLRQHASDVAAMRTQSLRDLAGYGLARKLGKGEHAVIGEKEWRSPTGEYYAVLENANQILHNAFNTKSLWNLPGAFGATFRGAMGLKNTLVPIKLALSAFHPIHVATIDNATSMVRSSKGLLSGTVSPAAWLRDMGKGVFYKELLQETGATLSGGVMGRTPKAGYRMLQVWKGKVPDKALTDADRMTLQYMTEGGFIPEMASQYKNNSIRKWKDALIQRSGTALFHTPFAFMEALQKPMFEVWIPSLKAASYIRDVQMAMKADPSLAGDSLRRLETFRRLAKSVDNRYGEMAYNTLFWNRWVKDLGVASTLSLGWNLGFLREYGGAALDIAGHLGSKDTLSAAARKGNLDRALFVSFYTTQALAYGGLMTWALTGKPPSEWKDYFFPKTGDKNPDGTDARVNTMFYPREFAAIGMHMQKEGVASGLGHLIANKASPVIGLGMDWASNVDFFGKEISDPNATAFKQLEQKLAYTFKELEPISLSQVHGKSAKAQTLSVLGFGPAPKYATETPTEGAIKSLYTKYHKTIVPYERAQYSDEARDLKGLIQSGDQEAYRAKLSEMKEKYHLNAADIVKLRSNAKGDSSVRMFKGLTTDQQVQLMRDMTPEEITKYRPAMHQKAKTQFRHEAEGGVRD